MVAVKANPVTKAFQAMSGLRMVRLRDPGTGAYLHLSGRGTTQDIDWSWLGYPHQAETLRERARMRGEDWPFRMVARGVTDHRESEE